MQFIQVLIEQLQAFTQKLTAAIANLDSDQSAWLRLSGFIDLGFFLLAINALARMLLEPEMGIVAIVLATHAIFRAFSNIFIDQVTTPAIVKCDGNDLNRVCNIAYRLNWWLAIALFLGQAAIAFGFAKLYNNSDLLWLIGVLAFTFAIYPQGTISFALRQRYNREQNQHLSPSQIHTRNQTQASLLHLVENSINYAAIAVLVWSGLGIWAIVVAAFIACLMGQWLRRKSYFWRPNPRLKLGNWRSLFKLMNAPVDLATALIVVLRVNLVYLLVGWAIDLATLGLFFIAINGGLMITLKIIRLGTAAKSIELGQLSASFRGLRQLYLKHYQQIALITIPLVVIQATLAPFYMTLVFGSTWEPAVAALIILLLSALPRPFAIVGNQLLTVTNHAQFRLYWQLGFLAIVLGAVAIGTQWQLLGVCIGIAIAYVVAQGVYALVVSRYCLPRLS
jgi:teichuronic acid exporter